MTIQERKAIPIPQVEPRKPIPQQNLRIPGPTPVPAKVLKEMAQPMINHRGPEFAAILRRVTARLQYFFQTASPVLTYPASGTGGQEAAVANLFSPGEHVVAITIGVFGNRFATIAERFGLQVTRIEFPWGEGAEPGIVEERLKSLAPYRAVLMTHNVEMDPWDIDVVFTGSQKGWMTPPGLMMIAAGPRAWVANKTARLPRFYFDWELARKNLEKWQHPTTPPLSIFYALDLSLEMMLAEGREAIFERHQRIGDYVRWRSKEMGLRLLADHQYASNTVTAVLTPESIDSKKLLNTLREQDQVVFGGGQQQLDGKIFRVGHLGYFEEVDLVEAMDKMEMRLQEFGFKA